MRRAWLLLAATGCSSLLGFDDWHGAPDAGGHADAPIVSDAAQPPDTGPNPDAFVADAFVADAFVADAFVADAARIDASPPDAGVPDAMPCFPFVTTNIDACALTSEAALDISGNLTLPTDGSVIGHLVSQAGGGIVLAIRTPSLTIRSGAIVTFTGTNPVVIVVDGDADIQGTIDVSATLTANGPGVDQTLCPTGNPQVANGVGATTGGGGGAGGSYGGFGGSGGAGGITTGSGANGGMFGSTNGGEGVPARGGCPGLKAGNGGNGNVGGEGGHAGGGVQLTVGGTLTLSGTLSANGAGGRAPGVPNAGGGGGGSGGQIFVEATTVTLVATAKVCANGGGGGQGGGGTASGGVDGQPASCSVNPALGGTTGSGVGGPGGGGAAGTTTAVNGANGAFSSNGGGGGGGGGGAGQVATRAIGSLQIDPNAIVSPLP